MYVCVWYATVHSESPPARVRESWLAGGSSAESPTSNPQELSAVGRELGKFQGVNPVSAGGLVEPRGLAGNPKIGMDLWKL